MKKAFFSFLILNLLIVQTFGALQTVQRGTALPSRPFISATPTYAAGLIDAAGEKQANIFRVPKTGTITKLGFRVGNVTTAQTLRVGIETVDATTGVPTGTQYGGSTAGTQASPATNTYYVVSLAVAASATKGDIVAVVVQFDSTVGSLNINAGVFGAPNLNFPYQAGYTTAWTLGNAYCPIDTLEYSDGSYEVIDGTIPASAITTTTFNSGSTPDEIGIKFKMPFPCRVTGFWLHIDLDGDVTIKLYDSNNTLLQSDSLDKDIRGGTTAGVLIRTFNTAQTLTKDSWYRLTVVPDTVTSVSVYDVTVPSAAAMDVLPLGQNCIYTSRTNAGTWTDSATQRVFMGLIIDQFSDDTVGYSRGRVVNQ